MDALPVAALRRIHVALVDVPAERLAVVRAERVETIRASAAEVGLLQPIVVQAAGERFTLIAGAQRLAATRAAGGTEIEARVYDEGALDADGRQLAEIVENLIRRELTALERAEHLAALHEVTQRRNPPQRGGDRRSDKFREGGETKQAIFALLKQVAEKTGLCERSVRDALTIVRGLTAESKARLRGTAAEDNAAWLKALAAATPELQAQALDLLLSTPPKATTIPDALALAEGKVLPSFNDRLLRSTLTNFAKLPKSSQRAFLNAHETLIREHAKQKGWF